MKTEKPSNSILCQHHTDWVKANPQEAFNNVLKLAEVAKEHMKKKSYGEAEPYLEQAFIIADTLFDQRLDSPQLTTMLTSVVVMLSETYQRLGFEYRARLQLEQLRNKLNYAIKGAEGYETKVAFFKHCSTSLIEATKEIFSTVPTNIKIKKPSNYIHLPVNALLH